MRVKRIHLLVCVPHWSPGRRLEGNVMEDEAVPDFRQYWKLARSLQVLVFFFAA